MNYRNKMKQRLDFTLTALPAEGAIEDSFGREGNPRKGGSIHSTLTFGPFKSIDGSDIQDLSSEAMEEGPVATAISRGWLVPWDRKLPDHVKKAKARLAKRESELREESESIVERKRKKAEAVAVASTGSVEGGKD